MTTTTGDTALFLGGGGARAAYQAGVLRAIARRHPDLDLPILTGVSAGAINTAHLANSSKPFLDATRDLVSLWERIEVGDVFESRGTALFWRALKVGMMLSFGLPERLRVHGMVDTHPLRQFLSEALSSRDGQLTGIDANVKNGSLKAVALTTTRYDTGQTVTFYAGRDIRDWERPKRRGVATRISVDHVMASSALPLFFPSVPINGSWYGDGGVRLVAPLAPALHLGADRILAISTRYGRTRDEADAPNFAGAPTPAQVLGVLYNAVFLDQLDQDAIQLARITSLVAELPAEKRRALRPVDILVIRPSEDLGAAANRFEPALPFAFRLLTRRLGTKKARSQDLLSTVLFQSDYTRYLIELGERDGDERADEIAAFLQGASRDAVGSV